MTGPLHGIGAGDVAATARYGRPGEGRPRFGQAPADDRTVTFHDMRDAAAAPTLGGEGFALFRCPSAVADFEDADEVARTYLPEVQALVRQATGSPHVYMQTNWVLRAETRENGVRQAAGGRFANSMKTGGFVHVDYAPDNVERHARAALDLAGVAERPAGRLLVVTAWRALSRPPQDRPLALVDRRTVAAEDLILEDIVAPGGATWTGYQLAASPRHRFCWWSDMQADELILFVQHEDGHPACSAAPHTAFPDPRCPDGTPPRASIEARAYAFLPG